MAKVVMEVDAERVVNYEDYDSTVPLSIEIEEYEDDKDKLKLCANGKSFLIAKAEIEAINNQFNK